MGGIRAEERRGSRGATRAWLDEVVATSDPVVANRAITRSHFELSMLLDDVLGPDSGANFHTWAVWGSREAGTTISRRDVPGLRSATAAVVALVAAAISLVLTGATTALLVGVALGLVAAFVTQVELDRARTHISHGNRIVLDEIGGVTLRYVEAVRDTRAHPDAVAAFFDDLEPGPTDVGGQDLLRVAFTAYHDASHERDRERRHQLVFAANCFAVWHEHLRLQHDIASGMPPGLRRVVTRRLLDFMVGPEHLHVGRDLAPAHGDPWPDTLTDLHVPVALAAVAALREPTRAPDSLAGSAATSWATLSQRMNYVVDLFRSRHLAPGVFDPPYPESP